MDELYKVDKTVVADILAQEGVGEGSRPPALSGDEKEGVEQEVEQEGVEQEGAEQEGVEQKMEQEEVGQKVEQEQEGKGKLEQEEAEQEEVAGEDRGSHNVRSLVLEVLEVATEDTSSKDKLP